MIEKMAAEGGDAPRCGSVTPENTPPDKQGVGGKRDGTGKKNRVTSLKEEARKALEEYLDVLINTTAKEGPNEERNDATERVLSILQRMAEKNEESSVEKALDGMERRLGAKIERMLGQGASRPIVPNAAKGGRPQGTSWAERAAMPPPQRQAGNLHVVNVRVERKESEDQEALFSRIKEHIPAATGLKGTATKGKVTVIVGSEEEKERIVKNGIKPGAGMTVAKRVYQAIVIGAPLSLDVGIEGSKENEIFLGRIEGSNKKQKWKVKAARWLYTEKQLQELRQDPKRQKGSIILTVETEREQKSIIQDGVMIGPLWLDTSLWDMAVEDLRCFRCQRWGHMQTHCDVKEACGHCAGNHPTRDCKTTNEECASCPNCKQKGHKAWWTRSCSVYKRYRERIMRGRNLLAQRTWDIRAEKEKTRNDRAYIENKRVGSPNQQEKDLLQAGREKRKRREEETQEQEEQPEIQEVPQPKRGPGRPPKMPKPAVSGTQDTPQVKRGPGRPTNASKLAAATRDASQPKLAFLGTTRPEDGETATAESPIVIQCQRD
jgi:hypothetical protein